MWSLPFSIAAARILQMLVRTWCTSWSLVGRGYFRGGLRSTRRRILWTVWYPRVTVVVGWAGGGSFCVSGPAWICVWVVRMAQIQGGASVVG